MIPSHFKIEILAIRDKGLLLAMREDNAISNARNDFFLNNSRHVTHNLVCLSFSYHFLIYKIIKLLKMSIKFH